MTANEFLTSISFPPIVIWIWVKSLCRKRRTDSTRAEFDDAANMLLVMNEPFRRDVESDYKLIWEPILIIRRLLLLSVSTYLATFPILKLYPIGILSMLFTYHDHLSKPYTNDRLNTAQLVSFLLLILLTFINTFWAFSNNLDLTQLDSKYRVIGQVFLYLELLILIFPFIIGILRLLFYIFKVIYKSLLRKQD